MEIIKKMDRKFSFYLNTAGIYKPINEISIQLIKCVSDSF
jgi:hypothetical protein